MFTDIVEFTPQAEDLPEHETAELLNHHFALLGACIEHEHGVIDKYIGDSVMAVWGGCRARRGPCRRRDPRRARHRQGDQEDNAMRAAAGKAPIRMRIGLHSGPAVVGNIGAPGRVNFTVVGDTVNVANASSSSARSSCGDGEDVVLLVSGDTLAAVKDRDVAQPRRCPTPELRPIKGHDEPVEVYRLV